MLQLKNNFIFAPIKTGYSNGTGIITEKHLKFYTQRSRYLGALTPEPLYLDAGLRELPTQIGIDHDDKLEGLKKLTNAIHQFDTKVIAHLNHPGRMANPKIPGNYFLSSSNQACEAGGATPKQMTKEDIQSAIQLFVDAAKRVNKAGFDIIELQFGHGYLVSQFISPKVNSRKDEYGGSFENRIKFSLEILEAVKAAVNLPIIVRISGDEMIPDGIKLPEMIAFSKILKAKDVEAIHVSAGTVCNTPPWYFQHMFVPKGKTWEFADQIKKEADIPTIYVGQVNTKQDVYDLQNNYQADYIAVGRSLVADPNFIGIITDEVHDNIRPCLACAEGCLGGVKAGKGLQCLVNPEVGREIKNFTVTDKEKKIAVIGGGLAGMEAAITLKQRGHDVDLFEKNALGGQFNLAPLTPHKQSLMRLVPFYITELQDKGVNVIFKEVVKEDIENKYDEVIIATGAQPSIPNINGLEKFYWAEILLEQNLPHDKNVLIIGGGLIGVDIATALIPKNNKIIIVKRTTDFGEDMEMIAKNLSLKMMKEKGTHFSDYTMIEKIDGKTVYAKRNDEDITFEDIDIIVVSTGMKPYHPLKEELEKTMPIHMIGDANEIGNAQDAIASAYDIAVNI